MKIELRSINQRYENTAVLKDVNLTVKEGELIALLGPSGCGKTTLLKIITGLVPLDSGKVFVGEKDITDLSPQKRNTAMVFQSYALFPHMTVRENVSYGLKVRRLDKNTIVEKVNQILEKVELGEYSERKIHELSGGQQQRVALARALIIEPDILLFDEPLSNLDEKLRVSMRKEIRKIQREFGITSIYVTHDKEEAMAIADKIVIMKDGMIHQASTPTDIYFRPKSTFVADFMGMANIIEMKYFKINGGRLEFEILGRDISIDNKDGIDKEMKYIVFRPENTNIVEDGEFTGKIIWIENLGSTNRVGVEVNDFELIVEEVKFDKREYSVGQTISIDIDKNSIIFLKE